ncbi:MAG: 50S ribosomal protein L39e, partial [Nitrososphaeraceae archaeon]
IFYIFICLEEFKTHTTQLYHNNKIDLLLYYFLYSSILYSSNNTYQHLKVRNSIFFTGMAARKNTSRKKRLIRKIKQNRPVPAWVIIKTHRQVRSNPKRRLWRRSDVNVG